MNKEKCSGIALFPALGLPLCPGRGDKVAGMGLLARTGLKDFLDGLSCSPYDKSMKLAIDCSLYRRVTKVKQVLKKRVYSHAVSRL